MNMRSQHNLNKTFTIVPTLKFCQVRLQALLTFRLWRVLQGLMRGPGPQPVVLVIGSEWEGVKEPVNTQFWLSDTKHTLDRLSSLCLGRYIVYSYIHMHRTVNGTRVRESLKDSKGDHVGGFEGR